MNGNFIKIDRKMLKWEWYKNEHTKNVFLHCLLKAYWKDTKIEGKTIPRGSFVSSIGNIAEELSLTPMEVRTALKHLKSTNELTSKGTNRNTVFTVTNYDLYQSKEQTEQQTDNKQITNKQQTDNEQITSKEQTINKPLTTNEEYKEDKNIKNEEEREESKNEKKDTHLSERKQIIDYLNQKLGARYRHGSGLNKKYINARLNEGYTVDDFCEVIDKKCDEWQGTEREKYLRPETLFGNKFESYLNQNIVKEQKTENINANRESQLAHLLDSIRRDEENERNGG